MAYICVICQQKFGDHVAAQSARCEPGRGHILQEIIDGAWNPDTKERADFIPVDDNDKRKWAERAKELGYDLDD